MTNGERIGRNILGIIRYSQQSLNGQRAVLQRIPLENPFHRRVLEIIFSLMDEGLEVNDINISTRGKFSNDEILALSQIEQSPGNLGLMLRALTEEHLGKGFRSLALELNEGNDIFDSLSKIQKFEADAMALIIAHNRKTKNTLLSDYRKYIEKNSKGTTRIPTGIATLDEMLNDGLQLGGYSILGGTPGSGKTSFMLAIALNSARENIHVGFIEAEMTSDEIFGRMLGIMSGEDCDLLSKGYEPALREKCLQEIEQLPIEFSFLYERTLQRLSDEIKSLAAKGCKLIIIDYLQVFALKSGKASDEFSEIKRTSEILRGLALSLDIHLLCASSLNRNEFQSVKPSLASLYGSSGIGHDCSVAMVLYSDRNEDGLSEIKNPARQVFLSVLKNRNGARGEISLNFHLPSQRISEDVLQGKDSPF